MHKRIFQNAVLIMLAATFCCVNVFAQSANFPQKIITFDKLQKTIIPLVVSTRPSVKIIPAIIDFKIEENNGKFLLVIDKLVPEATYSVIVDAGTVKDTITWKVLPSRLDAKSMKSNSGLKLYYGKRLAFRAKLPQEAELPLQHFKIDYQFGNEEPSKNNPFSESFVGPNIPASARIVKIAVVYVYPYTNERVTLFEKQILPEQASPDIECRNAAPRYEFDEKTNSYTLWIDGMGVDYEVPIDANNSDPNASKPIRATVADVQAGIPSVEYSEPENTLRVYRGSVIDSTWSANNATFKIVENRFDAASGQFIMKIQMSGLPANGTNVRGTFAIKADASIINKKAGVSAKASYPCILAIDIPINLNKSVADNAAIMETKHVSVPADVFLKQQPWLAEKFKKTDFNVFYADAASIEACYNALTPRPERTPALEQAEQECTNADDIKKRIVKKQPVPQALIDEGGSPHGCEVVKTYYSALANYSPVTHVALLVSKAQNGKSAELLGALALKYQRVAGKESADMLAPVKVYSVEEAKAFVVNSTSFFDMLTKQIAAFDQSVIERKVMVETSELVSKSSSSKGAPSKRK